MLLLCVFFPIQFIHSWIKAICQNISGSSGVCVCVCVHLTRKKNFRFTHDTFSHHHQWVYQRKKISYILILFWIDLDLPEKSIQTNHNNNIIIINIDDDDDNKAIIDAMFKGIRKKNKIDMFLLLWDDYIFFIYIFRLPLPYMKWVSLLFFFFIRPFFSFLTVEFSHPHRCCRHHHHRHRELHAWLTLIDHIVNSLVRFGLVVIFLFLPFILACFRCLCFFLLLLFVLAGGSIAILYVVDVDDDRILEKKLLHVNRKEEKKYRRDFGFGVCESNTKFNIRHWSFES